MRAAPAVSVSAGVPESARNVVGVLGLVATLVSLVWAQAEGGWRFAVPIASLAVTLHLLVELHAAPRRRLRWDGVSWWLQADRVGSSEARGELTVACDFGGALLLRFVPAGASWGASVWLPLARAEVAGDWHALRCALYSPREKPAAAGSEALDA